MDNKIFITTWKDKITILEDKYEQMDDNDYKKRQLGIKIADLKRKHDPNVLWSKGTYRKEANDEAMKARLEAAHQKDLDEQNKEEAA